MEDGETIIKTCTDCWVVGKKSDQREFYVVLNQKNANLIEINGMSDRFFHIVTILLLIQSKFNVYVRILCLAKILLTNASQL